MGDPMKVMRAACVLALAVAAAVIQAAPAPAAAAPTHWLVKGQDLQPWDNAGDQSAGLAAQAAGDGVALPPVTYQLCGVWNGTTYGQSDDTTCAPGSSVLVVENYNELAQAVSDGLFTSLGIHTALYDLESWPLTPAVAQSPRIQSADPAYWIGQATALARANGIALIVSTGGALASRSDCWMAAARDGAYMVAIQSQAWGSVNGAWQLASWESRVHAAVNVVRSARRAAGTRTLAMVGLGTNTPLAHPVWLLVREYNYAKTIAVSNFWLNADNWGGQNQCNASQGGFGCPQIGVQFLKRIGAAA
jgi:hypothetical protein